MITGIPCGIIATWLIDTLGLRLSVILSAWLNCIGAVLRLVSAVDGIAEGAIVPLVFIGQTIAALAQPFVLFAPTKLSALWFGEDERAVSNMLATMGKVAFYLDIFLKNVYLILFLYDFLKCTLKIFLWYFEHIFLIEKNNFYWLKD